MAVRESVDVPTRLEAGKETTNRSPKWSCQCAGAWGLRRPIPPSRELRGIERAIPGRSPPRCYLDELHRPRRVRVGTT